MAAATALVADNLTLLPSTPAASPLSIQVMALVSALAAIFLHQLYSISFDFIDSTDVNAIGTDNLHMLDVLFLWCQRTRTLGIFFGCCACAASGHVNAPSRRTMSSRRFIRFRSRYRVILKLITL